MTEHELEEKLAPHRQWYTDELNLLEEKQKAEIEELIVKVEQAIKPLPVKDWWVKSLLDDSHPVTHVHNIRVGLLEQSFLHRTAHIWDEYFKEMNRV